MFATAGDCGPLAGAKLSNVLLAALPRSAAACNSLLHFEHISEGSFLHYGPVVSAPRDAHHDTVKRAFAASTLRCARTGTPPVRNANPVRSAVELWKDIR